MKLDVLCVTERRPHFAAILAHNFVRTVWDHGPKELVVVTSLEDIDTTKRLIALLRDKVDVIRIIDGDHERLVIREGTEWHRAQTFLTIDMTLPPIGPTSTTTLGQKRQRAVDLASGELVTWLDDDDWYAPGRCLELYAAANDQCFSKSPKGWYVALRRSQAPLYNTVNHRWRVQDGMACNWTDCLYSRRFVQRRELRFLPLNVSEDFYWVQSLLTRAGEHAIKVTGLDAAAVCIKHAGNVHATRFSDDPKFWPNEGWPPDLAGDERFRELLEAVR